MKRATRRLLYWSLFAVETAGMALILYDGIPIYRRLMSEPLENRPARHVLVPVLCVVAVMQIGYWFKGRFRPTFAPMSHPLLAHLLLFFARLSFIFAAGLFSLSLFRRLTDLSESLPGVVVLLLATFAQFCYARELERLGQLVDRTTANTPSELDAQP
jgi:hypothetical protein